MLSWTGHHYCDVCIVTINLDFLSFQIVGRGSNIRNALTHHLETTLHSTWDMQTKYFDRACGVTHDYSNVNACKVYNTRSNPHLFNF